MDIGYVIQYTLFCTKVNRFFDVSRNALDSIEPCCSCGYKPV